MLQQHLILHIFYLIIYFPSLAIYLYFYLTFVTLPQLCYTTKFLFYFYILLNSSVETDLQFLICKLSLLSGDVLFLEMAFLLDSDHPGGGCLNDVWDGFSLSKFESVLLLGFSMSIKSSSQSEELHQHLSCLPIHFSQYSFMKLTLSSSSYVWGMLVANSGSVNTWGGYPNPSPIGISVSELVLVLLTILF